MIWYSSVSKPGGRLRLGEPVGFGLGESLHLAGERYQHPDVVAVVVDVLAERFPHVDRMGPGRADHHSLGFPFHPVGDLVPEVLDDDLGLLGQVLGVEDDETGQRPAGLVRSGIRGRRGSSSREWKYCW